MAVFLGGVKQKPFDCIVETEGNYAGDASANRAIAHGLGVIPRTVILRSNDGALFLRINNGRGKVQWYGQSLGQGSLDVTAADAVNFYVGNASNYERSGNGVATTYRWWAFA
jgi:hypothetical protein